MAATVALNAGLEEARRFGETVLELGFEVQTCLSQPPRRKRPAQSSTTTSASTWWPRSPGSPERGGAKGSDP